MDIYFTIDIDQRIYHIFISLYRMASNNLEELDEKLQYLLSKGFIRQSVSPSSDSIYAHVHWL